MEKLISKKFFLAETALIAAVILSLMNKLTPEFIAFASGICGLHHYFNEKAKKIKLKT
jgi:hypothetical protein